MSYVTQNLSRWYNYEQIQLAADKFAPHPLSRMPEKAPLSIDEYIHLQPAEVQAVLQQVRATIQAAAPDATESISYGMPTFNLNGSYLIYFAAHKKHIGLYGVSAGNEALNKEFEPYKTSGRGTIQFPLNQPMPLDLITKIVHQNVAANKARMEKQKTK